MIDIYATSGTVADSKALARDLATTLMKIGRVPDIPIRRRNTAAFAHDLLDVARSNVEGNSTYVRLQVLTDAGTLDREKQVAVVRQFTALIADAARRLIHDRPHLGTPDRGPRRRLWLVGPRAPE
jgi:hypothetical protein